MTKTVRGAVAAAWLTAAAPLCAQTYDPEAPRPAREPVVLAAQPAADDAPIAPMVLPFTGATIGLEAGWIRHGFTAHFTDFDSSGETAVAHTEGHGHGGFGGGAFAGYDFAVAPAIRLGAEVEVVFGGGTDTLTYGSAFYAKRAHYGLRGVLRAGYVLTPRLMGYATLGYATDRYGIDDTLGVSPSDRSPGGLAVGGGAEYRIDRRFGVRLDYKHADDFSNQLFVGVPVRF